MAITFKELRRHLSRTVRLSICFKEDMCYDNYLILSDIPEGKYDEMYVYGIGKIDVEFTKDVYSMPLDGSVPSGSYINGGMDILPALEIVLWDKPRTDVGTRKLEVPLLFGDIRKLLQIFGHISVVMLSDWSSEAFEERNVIPEKYNDHFVYGIGLEDDPMPDIIYKNHGSDTCGKKRIVVVLSKEQEKKI